MDSLSDRAQRLSIHENKDSEIFWKTIIDGLYTNPWSQDNPNAPVNFYIAANSTCADLMEQKLSADNRKTWDMPINDVCSYRITSCGGYTKTLKCMATFIDKYFHSDTPVDYKELVLMSSCSSGFDMIPWAVANPGEVILAPAPCYNFGYYMSKRTDVISVVVPTDHNEETKFRIILEHFVEKYEEITKSGKRVCAILLINPHNPLGCCYSQDDIIPLLNFAHQRNLFVIFDEIYGTSVHDSEAKFSSYHSFRSQLPDPQRTVWMWSFSKDMCMPGLRFGVIHTANEVLRESLQSLERIHPVPQLSENLVINILSDNEWLDNFMKVRIERLHERCQQVCQKLDQLGIRYLKPEGGLYVLIDLRKFLTEQTFKGERELCHKLVENGVCLVPITQMNSLEPGWFRLVFSREKEEVDEGVL